MINLLYGEKAGEPLSDERMRELIETADLKVGCSFGGVAVDHRDGETTVLLRRCGKWERESFRK